MCAFEQSEKGMDFFMEEENLNIPESYKPISMWGYFGYEILFSIPVIGLILLIVFFTWWNT